MGRYQESHVSFRSAENVRTPRDSSSSRGFLRQIQSETSRRAQPLNASNYHLFLDGSGAGDYNSLTDEKHSIPPLQHKPSSKSTLSFTKSTSTSQATPIGRAKAASITSSLSSSGSVRHADRFVPFRDPETPISSKIRVTKNIDDLSPTERLLRHHSAAPDFFNRPRQEPVPLASGVRSVSNSWLPFLSAVSQNLGANRNPSYGAVWTVGGTAPPYRAAVEDGRGHYFRSGTNARIFTANFSTARNKMKEDFERHQGMLADALRIDQTSRILDFRQYAASVQMPRQAGQQSPLPLKTSWTGSQWFHRQWNTTFHTRHTKFLTHQASVTISTALFWRILQFATPWLLGWATRPGDVAATEDLIVGDDQGNIYYYSVEWPALWEVRDDGWYGTMTLIANIAAQSQQICALAWSPDGLGFVSGSNDNTACFFEIDKMLQQRQRSFSASSTETVRRRGRSNSDSVPGQRGQRNEAPDSIYDDCLGRVMAEVSDQEFTPVAFCPWQENLVATGGGSSDKCINFWHASTGALLATIAVWSQVTSLIWSKTRPEIAATFGYAAPDHPYRIAVFRWPSCKQVGAVAWENGSRALYAVAYPGAPDDVHPKSRTAKEGTIIVAANDGGIKFHEVWGGWPTLKIGGVGMLGGSDILEGLDGIEKEGGVIR
ncbi:meiosis-specific apc c activator protein ama1 [Colletotrichum musicola]|uniref:Meiosis-specific apc c activator protein ama1 n=1 Tax=Colletotrichum musicola TaxID=2175873 RepID=A0A8H6KIG9_9PEZI|nr:meiosis-specific apc c activator protein ama1 [Colletotrichum musicola]